MGGYSGSRSVKKSGTTRRRLCRRHQRAGPSIQTVARHDKRDIPIIDVYLVDSVPPCPLATALSHQINDAIINLSTSLGIAVVRDLRHVDFSSFYPTQTDPGNLAVVTRVTRFDNTVTLGMSVMKSSNFEVIWQSSLTGDQKKQSEIENSLLELSSRFFSFLLDYGNSFYLHSSEHHSAELAAGVALKGLFIPGSQSIEQLDSAIDFALKVKPRGIYHTLRATASMMRYGERLSNLESDIKYSINNDLNKSMALESQNSVVLAWAGHAHGYFFSDHYASLNLTQRAIEMSPNSWLCWLFRTTTLSYANKGNEAYRAARKTLSFPIPNLFRPFVESNCCLAACLAGDFNAAKQYGELSIRQNKRFQSTARTLLAVYSSSGEHEQANKLVDRIRKREEDFSIDLVSSDDYPIPSSNLKQLLITGMNSLGL